MVDTLEETLKKLEKLDLFTDLLIKELEEKESFVKELLEKLDTICVKL